MAICTKTLTGFGYPEETKSGTITSSTTPTQITQGDSLLSQCYCISVLCTFQFSSVNSKENNRPTCIQAEKTMLREHEDNHQLKVFPCWSSLAKVQITQWAIVPSLESLGLMLTLVSKSPRIRLSKTGDPRFFEQTIMPFTWTVKILPHRYNSSRFVFVSVGRRPFWS